MHALLLSSVTNLCAVACAVARVTAVGSPSKGETERTENRMESVTQQPERTDLLEGLVTVGTLVRLLASVDPLVLSQLLPRRRRRQPEEAGGSERCHHEVRGQRRLQSSAQEALSPDASTRIPCHTRRRCVPSSSARLAAQVHSRSSLATRHPDSRVAFRSCLRSVCKLLTCHASCGRQGGGVRRSVVG